MMMLMQQKNRGSVFSFGLNEQEKELKTLNVILQQKNHGSPFSFGLNEQKKELKKLNVVHIWGLNLK